MEDRIPEACEDQTEDLRFCGVEFDAIEMPGQGSAVGLTVWRGCSH